MSGWLARANVERRTSLENPVTSLTNPSGWLMDALGAMPASSGVRVSEHTAMKFEVWWVCVRIISDTLGTPPLILYERLPGGGKRHATDLPLFGLLHDEPNSETTSQYFRQTLMAHVCNWGNCYAEIERNGAGDPIGLWPLLPDRTRAARVMVKDPVTKEIAPQRVVITRVPMGQGMNGSDEVALPAANVLHIPGLGYNGVSGHPVVRMARESIGHAIAKAEFGARFFGNGARPAGIIEMPNSLDAPTKDRLRAAFEIKHQGLSQAHRLMVLDEGMKWTPVSVPPDSAQFVESSLASVASLCRWHRIPPHMAQDLSRGTFSNIEVQSIEFIRFTMLQWFVAWEQWLNKTLLTPAQRKRYFFEFLIEGFLRGSLTERYAAYAVGRQWGWLCADDVRELENMNPLPNGQGQIFMAPMNMVPADQLANVGQKPDPLPPPGGVSPDDEPASDPAAPAGGSDIAKSAYPSWTSPLDGDAGARPALAALHQRLAAMTGGAPPPSAAARAFVRDPADVTRAASAAKKQRQQRSAAMRNRHRVAMLPVFRAAAAEVVGQEVKALRQVVKRAKRAAPAAAGPGRRVAEDVEAGETPMRLAAFDSGMQEFYDGFGETIRRRFHPVISTLAGVVQPVIFDDELGVEAPAGAPDPDELAAGLAGAFAARHIGSAMGQLRAIVRDAVSGDLDVEALIEERLGQWLDRSPDKISGLESVRSMASISKSSYQSAGVTTLTWMGGGGKSCDLCSTLIGQTVEITSNFRDAGDTVDPGEDSDSEPLKVRGEGLPHSPLHEECDCTVSAG